MSRANPTLVGAFVVGGVALAVAAAVALGMQGRSGDSMPFVVHLEGTANGLRVGAPVKFKGVEIGTVDRIAIHILDDRADLPIAVLCSINAERLTAAFVGLQREPREIPDLVANGLRARLGTESLVTGILYVSLLFAKDEPGTRHGDLDHFPEVPCLPSSSEILQSGLERVIAKLQELDLAGLIDEGKAAVRSVRDLGTAPEIRSAILNLDQTLARLRTVAETLDKDLAPIVTNLSHVSAQAGTLVQNVDGGVTEARETLATLRRALDHFDEQLGPFSSSIAAAAKDVGTAATDFSGTLGKLEGSTNPNAPLIVQLQASLAELAGAARAARTMLEQLEREPSQLLRGRRTEEGESR